MAESASGDVVFLDPTGAERNLSALAKHLRPDLLPTLRTLLSHAPDPDAALNLLERLCARNPDTARQFAARPASLHYVLVLFGHSQWLGEALVANPDLLATFARDKVLERSYSREDFEQAFARLHARSLDAEPAALLARFRRRESVRIALRDLLGIATLAEVTAEISALADVLVEQALAVSDSALRKRFGAPQLVDEGRTVEATCAVLALGKLGGHELNYSSDIDLLFLHRDGAEAPGSAITNREYFIRLAQNTSELLSRPTREGSAFRVDLRLRPQGNEGEPAVGLKHAGEYYAARAHDWERQALVKARHCAGDAALARDFLSLVRPFVYAPVNNFEAIHTAVRSLDKIRTHRRKSGAIGSEALDVKLDPGGIRDIEFLVQCLQRVYGGAEPWLRSGGTLFSLQKLHDKRHIAGADFHGLTTAYEFLRALEHRLQLRHGQQTHKVPSDPAPLRILARSLAPRFLSAPQPEELAAKLQRTMASVREIYDRILRVQSDAQSAPSPASSETQLPGGDGAHRAILARLAVDAPKVHAVATSDLTQRARRNLMRFLAAAATSPERYDALVRAAEQIEGAVELFAASDLLSDMLVRRPELIALAETGAATVRPPAVNAGGFRLKYAQQVFASCARDVLAPGDVYNSLGRTSAAADEAISAALHTCGAPPGFAVLALGRLGTGEHDVLSDADLLFVREPALDPAEASLVATALILALSAYTSEGAVFPVDTRLRPRGEGGELVVTAATLEAYFTTEAQAWEAITYTKLRHVAGAAELSAEAEAAYARGRERFSCDAAFLPELAAMRGRLENKAPQGLKRVAGGVYDLDFVIGAEAVRAGIRLGGNLRDRLRALHNAGLIPRAESETLAAAAELYRAVSHAGRLVTGVSRKTLPASSEAAEALERLVTAFLGRGLAHGLDSELQVTRAAVREVFRSRFP